MIDYDARLASGVAAANQVRTKTSIYNAYGKRALDVCLVLLSMIVVVPFVMIAAALVALDGHNPFYTQRRVGKNGEHFSILKLRTMVPNADALMEEYLASNEDARREWDATQKLKNDPRITRIGGFLRKSSIDELPQLLNVLAGDMSLVGPRPMMVEQEPMYHGRAYYDLRPGLTGLWQISDRNNCDFTDRVKFDEVYHQVVSLPLDVAVMLRTFTVVLRGTGY